MDGTGGSGGGGGGVGAFANTLLARVLAHPAIRKVGVGIDGDGVRIREDLSLDLLPRVDLAAFAEKQASVSRGWVCQNDRLTSLAKTTLALLGITLCKARRIRMTNWERRPLSLAHEVYAALDAWVGAEALSVLEQAVGQRAEEDTSIAEHKRSASSSCRTPGDTRPSVSPGGPIPPEAGLLSAGGPVSPEAGILSGGGPVLPEVGLSSGGEPASPEAGLPLSRGGSIPPEAGLTRTASPGSGEAMLIDTPPPPPLSLARGCEITRERSRRDSHAPIE